MASSILAWLYTFVEIDLWPFSSLLLIQEGLLSIKAKVCAGSTGLPFSQASPGRNVVRRTRHPDVTIAVDWDVKHQTKRKTTLKYLFRGFQYTKG